MSPFLHALHVAPVRTDIFTMKNLGQHGRSQMDTEWEFRIESNHGTHRTH